MWEFIENYPKIGSTSLASIFTMIGYFSKTLIDLFIEKRKRKHAYKSEFWKEKLNASKKASEFYFEQLNLFELICQNIDLQLSGKSINPDLLLGIQNSINRVNERVSNPKNFEHHHINIFYDFDHDELREKSKELINQIQDVYFLMKENSESYGKKNDEVINSYSKVKNTIISIDSKYRSYLATIRDDLNKVVT